MRLKYFELFPTYFSLDTVVSNLVLILSSNFLFAKKEFDPSAKRGAKRHAWNRQYRWSNFLQIVLPSSSLIMRHVPCLHERKVRQKEKKREEKAEEEKT